MGTRTKTGSARTKKTGAGQGTGARRVDPRINRPSNADEQSPETLVPEIAPHGASGETASADSAERESRIAKRAYELAEARGFAPGAELEDWLQAERELAARPVKQTPPEEQFTG